MRTAAKSTPLRSSHVALGAKLVGFAGWEMPLQYRGILQEHAHTRSSVSVFDTCHMGEFVVEGSSAEADLSRLVSSAVRGMEIGQCRYGLLLNEEGGILDDLVVYRQGERSYMLVVNAATTQRDGEWIRSRVSSSTTVTDTSDQMGKLDVQGPRSFEVLDGPTDIPLERMRYYRFARCRLWDFDVLISRTGYTGELGYEIYMDAQAAGEIWDRLIAHRSVEPAGLGARDTLRLEMGYPLYGQDMDEQRTPLEAGLERHVNTTKDFIGKDALTRAQVGGTPEKLVGLALEGRQAARRGYEIMDNKHKVGSITSGSFAPTVGRAVALGYVASGCARAGTRVEVLAGSRLLRAQVAELPFYKRGTARAPPAGTSAVSRGQPG